MYRSIAAEVEVRQRRHLPARQDDLDEMLRALSKLNWGTYAFPDRENPVALAYVYDHGQYTDVIILRGETDLTAYRTPSQNPDILAPGTVVWLWAGDPVMGVRTMLALPPGAPNEPHKPPPGFVGIHPDERGQLLYRPRQHRWL
ncbi:hypothetical protein ACFQ1S_00680 [Kibdelosporangium lantanae]|uniref:Uncharacterized protein n=1 Tax=Kibdelosporangium lantanae TaxID=1497396 RepID=A0ABW3M0W8_9PSEU